MSRKKQARGSCGPSGDSETAYFRWVRLDKPKPYRNEAVVGGGFEWGAFLALFATIGLVVGWVFMSRSLFASAASFFGRDAETGELIIGVPAHVRSQSVVVEDVPVDVLPSADVVVDAGSSDILDFPAVEYWRTLVVRSGPSWVCLPGMEAVHYVDWVLCERWGASMEAPLPDGEYRLLVRGDP